MEINVTREFLSMMYYNFKDYCSSKGCSGCNSVDRGDCFANYVFENKYTCVSNKKNQSKKTSVIAKITMKTGAIHSIEVNPNYYKQVKKYVLSIIDIDSKVHNFNRKQVTNIELEEYLGSNMVRRLEDWV